MTQESLAHEIGKVGAGVLSTLSLCSWMYFPIESMGHASLNYDLNQGILAITAMWAVGAITGYMAGAAAGASIESLSDRAAMRRINKKNASRNLSSLVSQYDSPSTKFD